MDIVKLKAQEHACSAVQNLKRSLQSEFKDNEIDKLRFKQQQDALILWEYILEAVEAYNGKV